MSATYDYRLSPTDDPDQELREQADDDFDLLLRRLSKRIREALDTEATREAYVEARFKELDEERAERKAGV